MVGGIPQRTRVYRDFRCLKCGKVALGNGEWFTVPEWSQGIVFLERYGILNDIVMILYLIL